MTTSKDKEQVLLLRAQNFSIKKISEETGLAKDTITSIIRENREEVASLMSIESDTLLREMKLTREARLDSLGTILANIRDELSRRTLEDVPTEKLFKMYLDTQTEIREELKDFRFLYSAEEAESDKKNRISFGW